jgi:beta propeller repeat protein
MTTETTLVDASLFPRLIVRSGGRVVEEIEIKADLTIGRAEDNQLQVPDPKASRHHARIDQQESGYILADLGSANGTKVNGIQITGGHRLEHGDRIVIGDTELTYQEPRRSEQDTLTMAGLPPAVQAAATATKVAGPVPAPPGEEEQGPSRGLVIGLAVAAVVLFVAIVLTSLYFLAPGLYEQIGLIRPASPTAPEVVASVTSPSTVSTGAATPGATVITATPTALEIDVQEIDDLLTQADALIRRSKFEEAIAIYEVVAPQVPEDPRPQIGWAWALILDEKASEGLLHAETAVEVDPLSAEAAAVLARAHADLGNRDEALSWGQNAVELEPGSAQAHATLAEAYLINGQNQEATDEADLALVQDINNADAHRVRGWLYLIADNDMGRAASELQIAAGLQPELWLRRHELGMLLLEAEDYVTAIMAFQDALGIRPKAVTYSAIGEAYYQLGQYDQARASLQQALSAGAEDVDTYALLAATYAQLGRCEEAETYYGQALEIESAHPLAEEAKDLCEAGVSSSGPTPTPEASPEASSESTPTPGATSEPASTRSQQAALSGQIAFPVWDAGQGRYDVYMSNVDGSDRHLIAGEMHQPALRSDGVWLVLNGERSSYENLVLAKTDGSVLREITSFLEDGQPTWSPDGQKLAFASSRHGDKQYRIYILDDVPLEGGTVDGRTLNYGPDDIRGQMPAWTSDGRSIVYRGCDLSSARTECNGLGLYIVSAAPGPQTPTQLTEHPEDTAPSVYEDKIAFMSNRDGNWEIYVMNLDGSGVRRLTENAANDGLPIWALNGRNIAFLSDQGGAWAVWVMSPDGSSRRSLFAVGGDGVTFDWQHERISWGR